MGLKRDDRNAGYIPQTSPKITEKARENATSSGLNEMSDPEGE
jgi:hypothetical protein